ncbi:unnamed protein product [Euphydryas editha]|uniref:Uncharacterized protein n=1 Tax=Euphydryas editha TaxID=104508 RepID=A0AAU9V111_EUPED|nr:unnamed protein product [Euphydryas editha]
MLLTQTETSRQESDAALQPSNAGLCGAWRPVWRVAACVARGAWRPVWRVAASGHWSFRHDLRQGLYRDLVSGQCPGRLWPFRHDLRQGLYRDLVSGQCPGRLWPFRHDLRQGLYRDLVSGQDTDSETEADDVESARFAKLASDDLEAGPSSAAAANELLRVVRVRRDSYLWRTDYEDEESTAPSITQPSNVDVPGNAIEPHPSTPGMQTRGEEPAASPTFTSSDDGSEPSMPILETDLQS